MSNNSTAVVIVLVAIALALFGLPAISWAAIALTFPPIGLTYWQAVALYVAFRVATLHLQPARARKADAK